METIMRVRTLLLLAVLGAVVAAIAATTAIAQQGDPQQPSPQAARDAHTSYAGVSAAGGLQFNQSLGTTGIVVRPPPGSTLGKYLVEFDHNVINCAYTATLGAPGAAPVVPGEISATHSQNPGGDPGADFPGFQKQPDRVLVRTWTSGGLPSDRSFFLTVSCADIVP